MKITIIFHSGYDKRNLDIESNKPLSEILLQLDRIARYKPIYQISMSIVANKFWLNYNSYYVWFSNYNPYTRYFRIAIQELLSDIMWQDN